MLLQRVGFMTLAEEDAPPQSSRIEVPRSSHGNLADLRMESVSTEERHSQPLHPTQLSSLPTTLTPLSPIQSGRVHQLPEPPSSVSYSRVVITQAQDHPLAPE